MEDLETKINDELVTLKNQLASIQVNSVKFTDLDQFRRETEERRNRLLLEQEDLVEKKNEIQSQVNNLQRKCDSLQVRTFFQFHIFQLINSYFFRWN